MAEARETPMSAQAEKARQMITELTAGDREVSQSEPVSPEAEPAEAERQVETAEASTTDDAETKATPTDDGEAKATEESGLDLEWIDKQDSEYADLLTDLHAKGHIDDDQFKAAKQAYMPRKGMYQAQEKAAKFEKDARRWEETGQHLFDDDQARQDFLAWRESRDNGQDSTADVSGMDNIRDSLKKALTEGDDDGLTSAIVDAVQAVAGKSIETRESRAQDAVRAADDYTRTLQTEWAPQVSKQFVDVEGATKEDIDKAGYALEQFLEDRRINAMETIQSAEDLRKSMEPFVKEAVATRRFHASVSEQRSDRSKQYDDQSLKASSAPSVSTKAEEDLTTAKGRLAALQQDEDIQALMGQIGHS